MQKAAIFLRGITNFEEEFLAHIVLPNGKGTVGDWLMPQIDKMAKCHRYYRDGDSIKSAVIRFRLKQGA